MNEDYVKAFVANFKSKIAEVISINAELETVLMFKDQEIKALQDELASLKPAVEAVPAE